jgi:hypothetical protein
VTRPDPLEDQLAVRWVEQVRLGAIELDRRVDVDLGEPAPVEGQLDDQALVGLFGAVEVEDEVAHRIDHDPIADLFHRARPMS